MQASTLSKHILRTIKLTKALLTLDRQPVTKGENLMNDSSSRVGCYTRRASNVPEVQNSICSNGISQSTEKRGNKRQTTMCEGRCNKGKRGRTRTLFNFHTVDLT